MKRFLIAFLTIANFVSFATITSFARENNEKEVNLVFEDQFGHKQETKSQAGKVVVLIYGDRKANEECKTLGETIHVAFHPTAKGLSPEKAQQAPVVPLPNLPAGKVSPDVAVIPVASTGKIPAVVKSVLQGQIKKASPNVAVWLDTEELMVGKFGMTTGEPNMVVLDCQGRARHIVNGKPDQAALQKVAQIVQDLRAEAVK